MKKRSSSLINYRKTQRALRVQRGKHKPEHSNQNEDPAHPLVSDEIEARLKKGEVVYEDE